MFSHYNQIADDFMQALVMQEMYRKARNSSIKVADDQEGDIALELQNRVALGFKRDLEEAGIPISQEDLIIKFGAILANYSRIKSSIIIGLIKNRLLDRTTSNDYIKQVIGGLRQTEKLTRAELRKFK